MSIQKDTNKLITSPNWQQAYKIIYDLFCEKFASKSFRPTTRGFCDFLGISAGKRQKWEQGQWPNAKDLQVLHEKMGFAYRWLVSGEGQIYEANNAKNELKTEQFLANESKILQTEEPISHDLNYLPLIGFASCGIQGWFGSMSLPVAVEVPKFTKAMRAVMATGDSMLKAGIGNGHVCICDTTKEPMPGEAVYISLKDSTGALKLFLGREGEKIRLKGWLEKDENGQQAEFYLDVATTFVAEIAPVMLIRRRL